MCVAELRLPGFRYGLARPGVRKLTSRITSPRAEGYEVHTKDLTVLQLFNTTFLGVFKCHKVRIYRCVVSITFFQFTNKYEIALIFKYER